ncbi:MAG TPA: HEAT repeat domain-containing protein [Bryobacteraceae bacterium]|nr:HEAT repeat domain-containing protein [Bryobacteraceae bacterium]
MTRLFVVWSGFALAVAVAQQPPISNASLRQASASNGLQAAIQSAASAAGGPAWIGYAVPAIPGEHNNGCCWSNDGRGCGLEGRRVGSVDGSPATPIRLEGPSHVVILLRFEQGAAEKLRVYSPDCPLDAGGLPFYWLADVKAGESVALLAARLEQRQRTDSVVHAIAMHAGAEAEAMLVKLSGSTQIEPTRKSALFWLAASRGKAGYDIVSRAAREDPSDKVREHAVFALTQSKQPDAIPAIIRIAQEDKSPHVRKQAIFWLGRSKDARALGFLEQVLSR